MPGPPPWSAALAQTGDSLLTGCGCQSSNRYRLSGGCWSVRTVSCWWPHPSLPPAVPQEVPTPCRCTRPPRPFESNWRAAWRAPAGGCRWCAALPPSSCTRQTWGCGWGWWCWSAYVRVPSTCIWTPSSDVPRTYKAAQPGPARSSAAAAPGWWTAARRWTSGGPCWSEQPRWASAGDMTCLQGPPADRFPSS